MGPKNFVAIVFSSVIFAGCDALPGTYVLNISPTDTLTVSQNGNYNRTFEIQKLMKVKSGAWNVSGSDIYFTRWGDIDTEGIIRGMKIKRSLRRTRLYLDYDNDIYYEKIKENSGI